MEKIKAASRADIKKVITYSSRTSARRLAMVETTNKIFSIGASTGGVQALNCLLYTFSPNTLGTVIVQHMPARFTTSFAERLNKECAMSVKEAQNGDHVIPGTVLIVSGGYQMVLSRSGVNYYV